MRPTLRRPDITGFVGVPFRKFAEPIKRGKALQAHKNVNSWSVPSNSRQKHLLPMQELAPSEKNLALKIGMNERDKVLVFAGYLGDWSSALSKNTHVTHTDISKELVEFVKNKKRKAIQRFKVATAESIPQRQRIYDWSFSFEPIPLIGQNMLGLNLARSLLNNKGSKIVFSELHAEYIRNCWKKFVEPLRNIYGATIEIKEMNLSSFGEGIITKERLFTLITIRTNDAARKKAFVDLRLFNAIEKATFAQKRITTRELAKRFKISEIEAIKSVMRLEKLLGQKQKGLLASLIRNW